MIRRVFCFLLVSFACVVRANDADVAAILAAINNRIAPNVELTADGTYYIPVFHNDFNTFAQSELEAIHDVQDYLHRVKWNRHIAGNSQGITRGVWNIDQGVSGLAGVFTNREAYYLDPDLIQDGFVFWDYKYGDTDYITSSYLEFLSLTQGQEFDPGIFWDGADFETSFRNAFGGTNGPSHNPFDGGEGAQFAFWVPWQAEAWRRQLAASSNLVELSNANVTNLASWMNTNTRDETNIWEDVLVSSTNDVGQGYQPSDPFAMPTNAVTWFGPSDGEASVAALLPELGWELQGEQLEAKLFGFEELDEDLSGMLSIDFSSAPWPQVRSVLQFAIAVTTCCVLVAIVRSEVNYWTTLGGSST